LTTGGRLLGSLKLLKGMGTLSYAFISLMSFSLTFVALQGKVKYSLPLSPGPWPCFVFGVFAGRLPNESRTRPLPCFKGPGTTPLFYS